VIFICENNGYAEFTPLSAHTCVERLSRHAQTYGIHSRTVDGNDVLAVRAAMATAVARARTGKGPVFLECLTHRMRGHYEGDPSKYRELSELAEWKKKDPIARFTRLLTNKKILSQTAVQAVEREARERVERAAEFALASPPPDAREVDSQVTA
jgi:pyruvate dehydrogenase E1 component alpha subunit